jgi:hypothetical protein
MLGRRRLVDGEVGRTLTAFFRRISARRGQHVTAVATTRKLAMRDGLRERSWSFSRARAIRGGGPRCSILCAPQHVPGDEYNRPDARADERQRVTKQRGGINVLSAGGNRPEVPQLCKSVSLSKKVLLSYARVCWFAGPAKVERHAAGFARTPA